MLHIWIISIFILACKQDAGKYMVRGVNDAGEAQSIADFIIFEPTPERHITEIVDTVDVENIDGPRVRISKL